MCFMLLSLGAGRGGGYENFMLSYITQKAANVIKKNHTFSEFESRGKYLLAGKNKGARFVHNYSIIFLYLINISVVGSNYCFALCFLFARKKRFLCI